MDSIADALIYAVTYINLRHNDSESGDDDDVGALESIVAILRDASNEELRALGAAAERALAAEKGGPARSEFVLDYGNWMDDMVGEQWQGNKQSA